VKKFKTLVAAVFLLCVGVANADMRGLPRGDQNTLATADYGGVDISTWTISFLVSGTGVGYSTVTLPGNVGVPLEKSLSGGMSGSFYGIIFGSGTTSDFCDVFDSTSADSGKNTGPMVRLYNVNASSGGPGAYASGFSGTPKPMRFNKGLILRPSRSDFHTLGALFYVFQ